MSSFSSTTLLQWVGYSTQLLLLSFAITLWLAFWFWRVRASRSSGRALRYLSKEIPHTPTEQWHFLPQNAELKGQQTPVLSALCWTLAMPSRWQRRARCDQRLNQCIRDDLAVFEQRALRLQTIAPTSGLFFTVVGLMLATGQFQHDPSLKSLLAAISPALGTTALGMLTLKLSGAFLDGPLFSFGLQQRQQGEQLLAAIEDAALVEPAATTCPDSPVKSQESSVKPPAAAKSIPWYVRPIGATRSI